MDAAELGEALDAGERKGEIKVFSSFLTYNIRQLRVEGTTKQGRGGFQRLKMVDAICSMCH